MSEKEFVVVDGVAYPKGTEPLSWAEKIKRMNAKTTEMPVKAVKTKKAKVEEPVKAEKVEEAEELPKEKPIK